MLIVSCKTGEATSSVSHVINCTLGTPTANSTFASSFSVKHAFKPVFEIFLVFLQYDLNCKHIRTMAQVKLQLHCDMMLISTDNLIFFILQEMHLPYNKNLWGKTFQRVLNHNCETYIFANLNAIFLLVHCSKSLGSIRLFIHSLIHSIIYLFI